MNNWSPTIMRCLTILLVLLIGGCTTISEPKSTRDEARITESSAKPEPEDSVVITDLVHSESAAHSAELTDSHALRAEPDLWVRLRNSFRLEYSNKNDPFVKKFEKSYSKYPKYFENLATQAFWYLPYILEQVAIREMPAEIALVPAIESAFRPDAVSSSNAVGMWQIIGVTGRRFGLRQDWWMDGRRDMVQSTRAALDYLEFLSLEFNGDWELALAAYNAGEGTIRKALRRNRAAGLAENFPSLNLKKETSEYVPRLFAIRNIILNPAKFGVHFDPIPDRKTLAVIEARAQTDLFVVASLISVPEKQLRMLNHGYKRGVTPPNGPHLIVVPADRAENLAINLNRLSHQQRVRWSHHQVKRGDYLGRIAAKHNVTVNSIIQTNKLTSTVIKPGEELKIPISIGRYQFASASTDDIKRDNTINLHTVRSGDSLWKISRSYKVALKSLLRWNAISKRTLLYPGQQLIVGETP